VALAITENKAGILYDAGYTDVEKLNGVTVEKLVAIYGIGKDIAERIVNTVSGGEGSGSSGDGSGSSEPVKVEPKEKPEGAPKCFGKYPKKKDPGKQCRTCRFHKACK